MQSILSLPELIAMLVRNSVKEYGNTGYYITLDNDVFELDNDFKHILDITTGVRVDLTVGNIDIDKRAIKASSFLENPTPLSVKYLACLAVANPGLPKSVLVNAASGLKAHIRFYDKANFSIKTLNAQDITWITPETGIEHPKIPGYFFIPGLPDYGVNRNGEVAYKGDGNVITLADDVHRKNYVSVLVDGKSALVSRAVLVCAAFGKYTYPVSDNIYFMDDNPDNITVDNVSTTNVVLTGLTVELAGSDEDNIL